jgi:hypothetical protein
MAKINLDNIDKDTFTKNIGAIALLIEEMGILEIGDSDDLYIGYNANSEHIYIHSDDSNIGIGIGAWEYETKNNIDVISFGGGSKEETITPLSEYKKDRP